MILYRILQRLRQVGLCLSRKTAGPLTVTLLLITQFPTLLLPETLPFPNDELLLYDMTWPGGLSLGEVALRARFTRQKWLFESNMNADLPFIEIRGITQATADRDLCSLEFEKNIQHGDRTINESVIFDQPSGTASRRTLRGGGRSMIEIPSCARDGLTFLYYLRQQLAVGRIPPPSAINFGGQYEINLTYTETLDILDRGVMRSADKILLDVTGPKSKYSFDIFFGRDSARTPLLMEVSLETGTFWIRLTQ